MSKRASRPLLLAAGVLCSVGASAASSADEILLDGIVVTSGKVEESAIDALSGSSAVSRQTLDEQFNADRISEVLRTIPGVTTQETARDTATAVNIRGLQDFGRVNVLVDGARQNFQRSGHSANGVFYIEPEMIKRVDITRGPTATIYGSGAIGGVAAFETLNADDILKPGEYAAVQSKTSYGTNGNEKLAGGTTAVRVGNFDILGQFNGRWNDDYEDGSGKDVPGSNDETDSKLVKMRWRPATGHQITASLIDYNSEFEDQAEQGGSLRDTEVSNRQYTLGYTFQSPTNPLIDFNSKVYRNETELAQIRKEEQTVPVFRPAFGFPPFTVTTQTFPAGSARSFNIETNGFDIYNTSRTSFGSTKLALTYGIDGFEDRVNNYDPFEAGDELTPSGKRSVYGGFVQSHLTFFDIVDVIGALRYDDYHLEGGTTELDDSRVSPKVTVGVTPLSGFTLFATYAEGFRAPAVTETLVSGSHSAPADFTFDPNPNLRPEVAHNIEGGVNLKFDNVVTTGDLFRAKLTAFQNKVDDYIEGVFTPGPIDDIVFFGDRIPFLFDDSYQYRNISKAKLEGIEFEAYYDAQAWFAGLSAHHIRGKNETTGQGLYSVPADQVTLTLGFRALQEKLVAGARARFVAKQDRFVEDEDEDLAALQHAEAYTVLDLFAQYEATESTTINLNIDNVFDETYRQHLDQYNSPGFGARVGLTMRFGAE